MFQYLIVLQRFSPVNNIIKYCSRIECYSIIKSNIFLLAYQMFIVVAMVFILDQSYG